METYLYAFIWVFGLVLVVVTIKGYAYLITKKELPQNNSTTLNANPEPFLFKSRESKPDFKDIKHRSDRWIFNERNLHKAILKGRRNGHLQIMYHGQYWATGLKTVTPCK